MTRRDFELIADAIRLELIANPKPERRQTIKNVAYRLNGLLIQENPNYNERRFLNEAGVERLT